MKSNLGKLQKILADGKNLSENEAVEFFDALQTETNENSIAAALLAFEAKGAIVDEIHAMAKLMRERAVKVNSKNETFVDIVGTGGSPAKIFNVSTAAAFVIAGVEIAVAKHGNRAATSNCGSADVLAELGVNPAIEAAKAETCLNEIGICFMFAPKFHQLSPILGKVRRKLGTPTIFNRLGPLCNPANAPHQVIGVYRKDLVEQTAEVLAKLGTKKSWVVHGADNLDEITLNGKTFVAEISDGKVKSFEISPADFGVKSAGFKFSKCTAAESAKIITGVLQNQSSDENARNMVLINAAAAIYISGKAFDLKSALAIAKESLESGKALEKLESLKEKTQEN